MGWLADAAFGLEALRRAWSEVLTNDRADGVMSAGVLRFEEDAQTELGRLVAELAVGAYDPRDLTEVVLPGDDHDRVLHIPAVRDRVVERSILDAIQPWVDPVLGPASFAYRPGLGVADALQEVVALREEGLRWLARTDIDDCFPHIPVDHARRLLGALVDDDDLLRVVDLLLARGYRAKGGSRPVKGLAQGCALSPLLANLVLAQVDAEVLAEGFAVVRYADDIVVAAASRDEAMEALRCLSEAVGRLGMSLGPEDTQVMSFDEGFCFLGEDFGPRYPPPMPEAGVEDPERKVLYVALQGSRVRTDGGRILVEGTNDQPVLDVPSGHVRRLVCFGSVGVSAGARGWAMSSGVDVVLASRRGTYQGSLVSAVSAPRAARVRAQVALQDSPAGLDLARSVISAKVRKQMVVLQRFGRREHADQVRDAVAAMEQVLRLLPDCGSPSEALGVEGAAAAAYFPALGSLLPEGMRFDHRTRRPPLDVANSALSFLYTVMLGECVTACYAAGLDPALGVMHRDQEDRPSLALDLLEEFRPMVVDQVVVSTARVGQFTAGHALVEKDRAGVFLTKAGREALIGAYERRMLTTTRGALPGFSGTIRRHVYRQAQRMAAAILHPGTPWTGLSWR